MLLMLHAIIGERLDGIEDWKTLDADSGFPLLQVGGRGQRLSSIRLTTYLDALRVEMQTSYLGIE